MRKNCLCQRRRPEQKATAGFWRQEANARNDDAGEKQDYGYVKKRIHSLVCCSLTSFDNIWKVNYRGYYGQSNSFNSCYFVYCTFCIQNLAQIILYLKTVKVSDRKQSLHIHPEFIIIIIIRKIDENLAHVCNSSVFDMMQEWN